MVTTRCVLTVTRHVVPNRWILVGDGTHLAKFVLRELYHVEPEYSHGFVGGADDVLRINEWVTTDLHGRFTAAGDRVLYEVDLPPAYPLQRRVAENLRRVDDFAYAGPTGIVVGLGPDLRKWFGNTAPSWGLSRNDAKGGYIGYRPLRLIRMARRSAREVAAVGHKWSARLDTDQWYRPTATLVRDGSRVFKVPDENRWAVEAFVWHEMPGEVMLDYLQDNGLKLVNA